MKKDAMVDGPQPTGRPPRDIDLTGNIIPFVRGESQPLLLKMPGSDAEYLAVFTTSEKMFALVARVLATSAIVETKLILDGREFLNSITVL